MVSSVTSASSADCTRRSGAAARRPPRERNRPLKEVDLGALSVGGRPAAARSPPPRRRPTATPTAPLILRKVRRSTRASRGLSGSLGVVIDAISFRGRPARFLISPPVIMTAPFVSVAARLHSHPRERIAVRVSGSVRAVKVGECAEVSAGSGLVKEPPAGSAGSRTPAGHGGSDDTRVTP